MGRSYFRDKARVLLSRKYNYIFIISDAAIPDKIISNVIECDSHIFTVFVGNELKINTFISTCTLLGLQVEDFTNELNMRANITVLDEIINWASKCSITDTETANIIEMPSTKVSSSSISIKDTMYVDVVIPPPILPMVTKTLNNFFFYALFGNTLPKSILAIPNDKYSCEMLTTAGVIKLLAVGSLIGQKSNIYSNVNINMGLSTAATFVVSKKAITVNLIDGTSYNFKVKLNNSLSFTNNKITIKKDITALKIISQNLLNACTKVSFLERDMDIKANIINLLNSIVAVQNTCSSTAFEISLTLNEHNKAIIDVIDVSHTAASIDISLDTTTIVSIVNSAHSISSINTELSIFSAVYIAILKRMMSFMPEALIINSAMRSSIKARLSDYEVMDLGSLNNKMLQDVILIYK